MQIKLIVHLNVGFPQKRGSEAGDNHFAARSFARETPITTRDFELVRTARQFAG